MTEPTTSADIPRSDETLLPSGDATLCAQAFGTPSHPPILLVAGAAASMDWWEDELCERLAAGGRYVVRYDNRDTGRSTSYPPGAPGYSGTDLVTDALAVLDGFGITAAHVAGVSMGGGIAQHLAVLHPQRVAGLTLMSTTPDGPHGPDAPELPPMEPRISAAFTDDAPEPDWSDRAAAVEHLVQSERPFAGSVPYDDDRARTIAGRMYDRTTDIVACQTNHWILEGGEPVRHRLAEITAPTLVMHGTDDPLLPFPHGEALAREIPGARLVALPGVGHQMPPQQLWDLVVDAVLNHTAPPR
ncbi:pimeloyl-ACP methyl ester carboxylesterase [Haloactinopolyspora alba]|uniref:Pimeloyl-ACP methyl ester carboxylesterase n=1 Tax=Haloactinopolyspora alba TaxID=648780 RepID=A0A2P8DXB4_9ACTN|nr:alpha/beta hydrolase [Haloactinopolyspora alba]PSL01861.1 pimeloyl-ACP methyl ester carboxylesterase [Haloactinopolyspora alba]